nr:ABC transporter ATP-binding protein [Phytoactinopolyspora alkaliphila]
MTGLTRSFGSAIAVDNVDLTVKPGEFMTLLGPSGSGKTTTLNMIAGFLAPDSGRIMFDGRDVSSLPANRRNIGMVFQNYALFPTMSVRDNVGYPLRQRRVKASQRRSQVDAALEMVELGHLWDRRPAELSGGQQQRVALARAIVHRPPLLLMDEPLGALDRRLRDSLQSEIAAIHRHVGSTVIYVTHDQDEALCLSDRIAVFRDGRIEQLSSPSDMYEQPETSFVASFLGDSNILVGTFTRDGNLRLPDGTEVRCGPADAGRGDAAVAGPATVVVRPERMRLTELEATPRSGTNCLVGVVIEERYLGATRMVALDVGGDRRIVVRENSGAGQTRPIGSRLRVCWEPADGVWIDRGADRHGESS